MSKRVKVLVSVLVSVLLLVASGTAIAMAQEEEEPAPTTQVEANGFLARVAEILDIPEEDLMDAFNQARQEMREEAFYEALDEAVEEGLITQEEAGEIKGWWEQKPEALDQGLFGNTFRFMGSRADCMPDNRLGVRAQIGSGLCQDGQQPLQQMRQQARQAMRQRACQEVNGELQ